MKLPYITIFTPTYNREKLLSRLYDSLCRQQIINFEWIVIDDESTDNTEKLVNEWINKQDKDFDIRYYKQVHGGKHRALNKGFNFARGVYFFIVDSDDQLTEDATKLVEDWGREIENMAGLAGLAGLRKSPKEILGGTPIIPNGQDWIEASNFERGKYNLWGDKAEVYKTNILKQFPFPEFEGEYFVTEAVCWDAIAAVGYKLRWYNIPIYLCEYLEDGLTKSGANSMEGHKKNYRGYCYYVKQCLKVKPAIDGITEFRQYRKLVKLLKKSLKEKANDLGMSVLIYLIWSYVVMPFLYSIRIIKKLIY